MEVLSSLHGDVNYGSISKFVHFIYYSHCSSSWVWVAVGQDLNAHKQGIKAGMFSGQFVARNYRGIRGGMPSGHVKLFSDTTR